jgi:hypothetical protein
MTALAARARTPALAAFAMGLAACGPAPRAQPAASAGEVVMPPPLRLDPLASIASGTGLEWLADVHPGALLSDEAAAAQVERVFSEAAAARFRARYGGVDLLRAQEIVVAGYDGALFGAVRAAVDATDAINPGAIEAAFARRAQGVEGRVQAGSVVRFWGTVDGAREQVAVFGHQAVAIEHGQLGPLRPAVLFAEGKLQRALPAMRAEPLAALFARLQDAPPPPPVALAFYAPGPFAEPWASGLGGLLRATTAAAVAATCAATSPRPGGGAQLASGGGTRPDGGAQLAGGAGCPGLRVRVVLAGSWGADGPAAGERLAAAFRALAADPLGRLAGLDHPLAEPSLVTDDAAVELDVTLDLASLAGGIHDATGASLPEILGLSAAH